MSLVTSKRYSGFTPESIPNLLLWFDSKDSSTVIRSGSNVTQWNDKSGNGYHATLATSSGTVTYNSNGLNFAGSGALISPFTRPTNSFNTNVIVVASSGSGVLATRAVFGLNAYNGVRGNQGNLYQSSTNNWLASGGTPATDGNTTTVSLLTNRKYILNIQYNPNSSSMIIDGVAIPAGSSSGTLTTGATMTIGCGTTSLTTLSEFWNGTISEIIIYSFELSNNLFQLDQRQILDGYLAYKYNITTILPSTHPFGSRSKISSPLEVPGCSLWLDAADSSTVSLSGSTVTQWNDKSGNNNNTTVVGGSPSYSNSSILLNGSSTYLLGPYINTTTTITAFVIATVDFSAGNSVAYYRLLSVGSTTANDFDNAGSAALILHSPSSTNIGGYRNSATNYVSVTTNTRFLLCQQYNGTTGQLYLNGSTNTSVASTGSFNTTSYSIGRDVGNPTNQYTYWPGTISEVIIFNQSLTTSQRQQVESYLATKWALSSVTQKIPYIRAEPVLRKFEPKDILGLTFWLDASDNSSVSLSGTKVTQWLSKVGNYAFVQYTDTRRPTYSYNATVKRNVLTFTSANLQYLFGPTMQLGSGANSEFATIFCVFSCATNTNGTLLNKHGTGFRLSRTTTNIEAGIFDSTNLTLGTFADSVSLGTFQIVSFGYLGGSNALYQNGTSKTTDSFSTALDYNNTNLVAIGANGESSGTSYFPTSNTYFNGNICEILVYVKGSGSSSVLTHNQRQQIEGYLAEKWNTKLSLPISHPFKIRQSMSVPYTPLQTQYGNGTPTLWFDASDESTMTFSGTNVTQWRDKKSEFAVSGSAPYVTISGRKCVQFTGSTTLTGSSLPYASFVGANNVSFATFIVFTSRSTTSVNSIPFSITGGSNQLMLFMNSIGGGSTGIAGGYYADGGASGNPRIANNNLQNETLTSNIPQLIFLQRSTTRLNFRTNGALYSVGTNSTSSTVFSNGVSYTLSMSNSSKHFTGEIYEIIHLGRHFLTDDQIIQIEGYLCTKWNIRNILPDSHPYKKL